MAAQLTDLQLPISELQVISKILMSLPTNYIHFVSAWDSVPAAEKTITLLTSRLLKEEKMTNIHSQNKPNPPDSAYLSGTPDQSCMLYWTAFLFFSSKLNNCSVTTVSPQYRGGYRGNRGNRGNFRGNRGNHPYRGGRGSNFTRPQCTYCGLLGHTADKCRKRIRDESNNQDFGYSSAFMNFSTRRCGHKPFLSIIPHSNEYFFLQSI